MKRKNAVVGIGLVCFFIVAIVIQAAVGMGLRIDPPEITVKPGTPITYAITLSSHGSDCYDVTVIPYTCNINWFEWTEKKQVCVAAGGSEQLVLCVTPLDDCDCDFKVRAVSRRNPRMYAESIVKIKSTPYWSDLPDFIITKIWQVGSIIHYELMNVGFADAPAGSTTALYISGDTFPKSKDYVNTPLAPNGRIQRSFNNYWGPYPFPGYTITVCANYDDAIKEIRYTNNCLEENWFNQPYLTDTKGPATPIPGSSGGGLLKSSPGVGGDGLLTSNPGVSGADGPSTFKSSVAGVNEAPTCIALMPDLPEPQPNGMVINWTACAFDPEGDALLYRFVLERSDLEMEPIIVQGWSPSNVWKWETNEGDVFPNNVIYADVRDGYHANDGTDPDYDKSAGLLYWIK